MIVNSIKATSKLNYIITRNLFPHFSLQKLFFQSLCLDDGQVFQDAGQKKEVA